MNSILVYIFGGCFSIIIITKYVIYLFICNELNRDARALYILFILLVHYRHCFLSNPLKRGAFIFSPLHVIQYCVMSFSLNISLLAGRLAVLRCAHDILAAKGSDGLSTLVKRAVDRMLGVAGQSAAFFTVSRTTEELSIVGPEEELGKLSDAAAACSAPGSKIKIEHGWIAFKVEGPLDFSLVGILSKLATTLAEAGVSIFAISTFDTDYILVKEAQRSEAIRALSHAGHSVAE